MALLLLLWLSIELLEIKVIKEVFMMNVEFLFLVVSKFAVQSIDM